MQLITETVANLSSPEYDINVYTEPEFTDVDLTFYPLQYPGDDGYKPEVLFGQDAYTWEDGIPVADYTRFYTLKVPKKARGPRYREALQYLEALVTEGSFGDIWNIDGMDWTSCDTSLVDPPALIAEFVAKLPRRGQLKASNK